jgi:hypothetical protein
MSDTPDYAELRQLRAEAERMRDEAAEDRRAAAADGEAAAYDRGQAEHRLRTAEDNLRAAAEDRRWLEQHDEAKVRAIVAAADEKLKQAQELMASYDAAKHAAALKLAGKDAAPEISAARDQEADVNNEAIDAVMAIILYHDELIHRALPRQPGDGVRMGQLLSRLRSVKRQAASSEQGAAA